MGVLRGAYVAGVLSLETLEQRAEEAFTVGERSDLGRLTDDVRRDSAARRAWRWATSLGRRSESTLLIAISAPPESVRRCQWSIGRSSRANMRIDHDTISRRHAVLERRGDAWLLRDCGSMNGMRVNGWRVEDEALVRAGDEITLGDVSIVLT